MLWTHELIAIYVIVFLHFGIGTVIVNGIPGNLQHLIEWEATKTD